MDREQIARVVARRYRRLATFGYVTSHDLQQEAWVAILAAERNVSFDPDRSMAHYVYGAAVFRLRSYLWRCNAPVSCRSTGNLEKLRGLCRVEVGQDDRRAPDIEEHLDRQRLAMRVQDVLTQIVPNVEERECVLRVLASESTAGEEAERAGVPVRKIYRLMYNTREALSASPELWTVWREAS